MTWLKRIFGLAGSRATPAAPFEPTDNLDPPLQPLNLAGALVPVFIEKVEPPLIFRQIQGCFLTEHDAEALGAQRRVLIEQLERMIGPPKA